MPPLPVLPEGQPDELIHQLLRLRIMAALSAVPANEPLEFTRLRHAVQATDGNLGAHLATLERAGYVQVQKDFAGRRPRTRVALTVHGRQAFARHVAYLRAVIEAVEQSPPGAAEPQGAPS